MINSLAPAVNAFFGIFFNLPAAIFNFISLIFGIWIVLGIFKILWGAKH